MSIRQVTSISQKSTVRRFPVTVTVDADGDGIAYTPRISGVLVSIRYVKTSYDDGVDFVITGETSTQTLWSEEDVTASATRYPRGPSHSTVGVGVAYAALGEAVNDLIVLDNERVKIVVAEGGDTTTGTFHVTVAG